METFYNSIWQASVCLFYTNANIYRGSISMKKEYWLASISVLFWGSSAAVAALLLHSMSTFLVVFYNGFIASVFLFLLNLFTGRLPQLKDLPVSQILLMMFLGILGTFMYSSLLYVGMQRLKTQQAFIINYLWPIMTVLFSCLILKKTLTLQKVAALLLSFFGVIIVATEGDLNGLAKVDGIGVAACVIAAMCSGLYGTLNSRVTCDKTLATMVYQSTSAVAALVFLLLTQSGPRLLTMPEFGGMLWNGILIYGVAATTWAIAISTGDTAKVSNLAYFTPFLSLVYIYFLLGEPISMASVAGLIFIILGVLVQMVHFHPTSHKQAAGLH